MAENDQEKTEEPTARRLTKARSEGQTAQSQEVKSWGVLMAATLLLLFIVPGVASNLRGVLEVFIQQGSSIPSDFEHLRLAVATVLIDAGWALAPILLVLVLVGLAVGLAQTGLIWAPKKVVPKVSNISLIKGAKRIVSSRALFEFLKGVFKITIVGAIGTAAVLPFIQDASLLPYFEMDAILSRIGQTALVLLAVVTTTLTVIAVADYAYQRYQHIKNLKMTKQEVKDEYKQTEGDPQIKAKIRSLRAQRAQARMMAAVPEADVVVTNPTHYAVALSYRPEEMIAPIVVAKGVDEVALRIRSLAEEHEVPIVENPPLAQALYATVELDNAVPPEHYKTVAEVIGYVMRLKGQASRSKGQAR